MKKLKIIRIMLFLGLLLITVSLFTACDLFFSDHEDSHRTDLVVVDVKEEYSKQFYEREFTLEDFKLDNAKDFFYYEFGQGSIFDNPYYHGASNETRMMSIRLIKTGDKYLNAARKHVRELEFVEHVSASRNPIYASGIQEDFNCYCTDHVIIFMRSGEYTAKFDAREFTLEDFKLDNAKDFSYYQDRVGNRVICLRLIETQRYNVRDAVRHLRRLEPSMIFMRTGLCDWFSDPSNPYCRFIDMEELDSGKNLYNKNEVNK